MPTALLMAFEVLLAGGPTAQADVEVALRNLAGRTIVFGHQSVGANLLDGLKRQAAAGGVALRVVEARPGTPLEAGALAHAYLGRNGDPFSKLAAFRELLAGRGAAPPDIAIFKLCWADFVPGTDVDAVFSAYQETFDDLAGRFPRTTFLHVTTPLTTVQGGARALAKRLLGRSPYGEVENARREAFNARLRSRYGGAVFDLARLEAEDPAGGVASHRAQGQDVLALAPGNTDDGGHLVPAAQDRIARALIVAIAKAR